MAEAVTALGGDGGFDRGDDEGAGVVLATAGRRPREVRGGGELVQGLFRQSMMGTHGSKLWRLACAVVGGWVERVGRSKVRSVCNFV